MGGKRHRGWRADWALGALIVLAPALGGSSRLVVMPILALGTVGAFALLLRSHGQSGRALHLTGLALALAALALLTALTALPWPASLLEVASPRALELHRFVGDQPPAAAPPSYEVSASLREVVKLLLYAVVATIAFERSRARKSLDLVSYPLVIAGVVVALLALVHRALGVERVLGLLPTRVATAEMITTFANPNHSAGFMVLAALAALGLAEEEEDRARRVGLFAACALAVLLTLLSLSRGGVGALLLGLCLYALSRALKAEGPPTERLRAAGPTVAVLAGALVLAGLAFSYEALLAEFARTGQVDLGPGGKLAAFRDAWPMVQDHPWLGIGRGAYISVYSLYKSSPMQLTFAYPENILVQLVAEWGVIVGPAVLLGLLYLLADRLRAARGPAALGALIGVLVLCLQNLVDFSLELAGVALPVVAILGATGHRALARGRPVSRAAAALAAPAGALALTLAVPLALAFAAGDLDLDLDHLAPGSPSTLAAAERAAARHPAHAYLALRAAYQAETASAAVDLKRAYRWANRALYLAPTYADAHLAMGRVLILGGRRAQGFEALREGWRLVDSGRKNRFVRHALELARTPAEVAEAVPREDPELDRLDAAELARLLRQLGRAERRSWAGPLLDGVEIAAAGPAALAELARVSLALGELDRAGRFLGALEMIWPRAETTVVLRARQLRALGDSGAARALLERLEPRALSEPVVVAQLLFELALAERDLPAAEQHLDRLAAVLPSDRRGQGRLARHQADLELARGNPTKAVRVLTRALELEPEDPALHVRRASVWLETGHLELARREIGLVLALRPKHRAARRLQAELERLDNEHRLLRRRPLAGREVGP